MMTDAIIWELTLSVAYREISSKSDKQDQEEVKALEWFDWHIIAGDWHVVTFEASYAYIRITK